MAKCKFCGAEVDVGKRCNYCGSVAESWYYPKREEPKKVKAPQNRLKDIFSVDRIYTVREGDTLWGISKKLYGAGAEYYRLVEKNHIQDPNHIEVGWKLYY